MLWSINLLHQQRIDTQRWDEKAQRLTASRFLDASSHAPIAGSVSHYGALLCLLRANPPVLAKAIAMAPVKEAEGLVRIALFSLYGERLRPTDECAILRVFEVRLCRASERASV